MDGSILGIGTPELIVIIIIAGIVMGPERIAKAARWLGETTAYLQNISRGFMNQLKNELDDAEAAELKGMLQEMRSLQQEVTDLRKQVATTTTAAISETKQMMDETIAEGKDAMNFSIAPPSMNEDKPDEGNSSNNGALPPPPPLPDESENEPENTILPPSLPKVIDIEDDPEN